MPRQGFVALDLKPHYFDWIDRFCCSAEDRDAAPGYASPQIAGEQAPEPFIYVAGLYEGTGIDRPDFIAVIDVDPASPQYGRIVHRSRSAAGHRCCSAHSTASTLYVTNSLYSTWENQFYPELRGWLTKLDRQADGSYARILTFVDFHEQTDGGARTRSTVLEATALPRSSSSAGPRPVVPSWRVKTSESGEDRTLRKPVCVRAPRLTLT